jgi:hypothetical protein
VSNKKTATLGGINGLESTVANPALPVALDDGHFVSARVVRLIEIIREKWPSLDVKWVPREMRSETQPAFLIVEQHQGQELPVFFVQNEEEFDGTVIERLIMSDSQQHNVHDVVEARNQAIRLVQEKIKDDAREERLDMVRSAVKSGKYDYTMPDKEGKIIKLDTHGGKILRGEV